ncbi:mandelate racemase/muconate lactonizing enzyme family protein [Variovorax sp. VNK109]|uniref:mandelate racemase/muconate lactonizing enzyme family protein n=1 Tax=Variovorax sp. VNK109 TaxID=3400919 RepID=UPI003C070899
MRIKSIEDFHVDGGWDVWSFLKITTDEGIVGWSEFSDERARRGLTAVIRSMAPSLIGKDPCEVGLITAVLRTQTLGSIGGLQALAIGAFENALLDVRAKSLGVPVYDLFGGALRTKLPLYWSHCAMYRAKNPDVFEKIIGQPAVRTLDDVKAAGEMVSKAGFRALKTNRLLLDPARLGGGAPRVARGAGATELNIEPWMVRDTVAQMEALRDGAGPDVALMLDLNFNYKTEGFLKLARALEPLELQWLEMDSHSPEALSTIRASTSTPIASLETMLGRRAIRPFAELQCVDVGIVDVVFNGLMESLRMASLLETCEINAAAHNTFSHLGTAISAHFCALIPNFRVLEFDIDEVPWRKDLVTHPVTIQNGELILSNRPGWGMDINESVAREHAAKKQ